MWRSLLSFLGYTGKTLPTLYTGRTVATAADLAGEDAPALITVGNDGAVFYWMYDPAPPGTNPNPQGYAQVPGKHRKRKASDMDSMRTGTVAAGNREASDHVVSDAAEDGDHSNGGSSSGSDSNSSSSTGISSGSSSGSDEEGEESREALGSEGDAQADGAEDGTEEMLASTSGRAQNGTQQQQQQTMSFAGEQECVCIARSHALCTVHAV